MRLLVSPVSQDEAHILLDLGVDIIDVKNPHEGSLGAQPPWVIQEIAKYVTTRGVAVSATLGDLPFQPGTAALAAFGAAQLGVNYIKVGLHGSRTFDEASAMLMAVRTAVDMVDKRIAVVAAGYGDYRRFDGLAPSDVVRAAAVAGCQVALLDTAVKDGSSLSDGMSFEELAVFVGDARQHNLQVALAGSLRREHLPLLAKLSPDFIGVRGALCTGQNRGQTIDPSIAREFVQSAREILSERPLLT